jgi:hypothetical protein
MSQDYGYFVVFRLTIIAVSTGDDDKRILPFGSQAKHVTGLWLFCCKTCTELVDGLNTKI